MALSVYFIFFFNGESEPEPAGPKVNVPPGPAATALMSEHQVGLLETLEAATNCHTDGTYQALEATDAVTACLAMDIELDGMARKLLDDFHELNAQSTDWSYLIPRSVTALNNASHHVQHVCGARGEYFLTDKCRDELADRLPAYTTLDKTLGSAEGLVDLRGYAASVAAGL